MPGPGIKFYPPLYFLVGGAVAWGLHRRLAFDIDGAGVSDLQWRLGLALVVLGSVLMTWAIATFARARTTVRPDRAANRLVTGGPYAFSRNPIYLADCLVYLGVALLTNSAWALVVLPFVVASLSVRVIRREEGYLRDAFGGDYDDYRRRTRRWM